MALTPRQQRFVAAYIRNPNGRRAAILAGYAEGSAEVQASRLLRNAQIREEIAQVQAKIAKAAEVDATEILRELKRIALADLRQAFDSEGRLRPVHELPEEIARAMSGVEVEQLFDGTGQDRFQAGVTAKVKFWDKPKALELLGKHLKLFTDKVELSGRVTLEQLVERSYRRTEGEE